MTSSLLLHCLAALAIVAALTSALVGGALVAGRSLLSRIEPVAQRRVLIAAALAPAFTACLALAAALLPSLGWATDHCLAHGHHPHLCIDHAAAALPTLPALLIAGYLVVRLLLAAVRATIDVSRSAATRRSLEAVSSEGRDGLRVLALDQAQAFVIGLLRPQVYVSRGLLAAGDDTLEPVLAHERAHLRRRDPLCRLLVVIGSAFHLPGVARSVTNRLAQAQEMTADADAARELGDPLRVAAALVRATRSRVAGPAIAMTFAAGRLEARVRALLDGERHVDAPGRGALLGTAAVLLVVAVVLATPIHHGLETFLGLLSS